MVFINSFVFDNKKTILWNSFFLLLTVYVIYSSICLMLNFLDRSHQCQLVMNGDFGARVICNMILSFLRYSIHWSKRRHLYIQIDPFALYFLYISYIKEKRKKKWVSKSDELLWLSECICHYRIVIECIVAVRSCVK
jgi:hypothetical protein